MTATGDTTHERPFWLTKHRLVERRGTRVVDGGDAVLLGEREDAEDATDADDAVLGVDGGAERADRRAGGSRAGEQLLRAVLGFVQMSSESRLRLMFTIH